MLEYIKGTLVEATPNKVIVESHGLGYGALIPLSHYAQLPHIGQEIFLYLSEVIREDSHKLYGFVKSDARDLFEKLCEISGIGPKTALCLVGHMDIQDLQVAISRSDISLICKVPGIGKKTAERLIVEMRDKIKKFDDKATLTLGTQEIRGAVADAMSALANLGYNMPQAQKAIKRVLEANEGKELGLAALITSALRHI